MRASWQVLCYPGFSHGFFGAAVPGAPANGITTPGASNAITVLEM
jgi:hypothetical protein